MGSSCKSCYYSELGWTRLSTQQAIEVVSSSCRAAPSQLFDIGRKIITQSETLERLMDNLKGVRWKMEIHHHVESRRQLLIHSQIHYAVLSHISDLAPAVLVCGSSRRKTK